MEEAKEREPYPWELQLAPHERVLVQRAREHAPLCTSDNRLAGYWHAIAKMAAMLDEKQQRDWERGE